jgi:sec-independent protein translocase protein TatB
MFDLDAGKLIVIGIVALIAIPSKDLPRVLRQIGQMTGKMRRMASEFQGQFMEAMREAELQDLQKEFKDLKKDVDAATAPFDPMADIRNHVNKAVEIDKPPGPAALPQPEPHSEQTPSEQTPSEQTSSEQTPSETAMAKAPPGQGDDK